MICAQAKETTASDRWCTRDEDLFVEKQENILIDQSRGASARSSLSHARHCHFLQPLPVPRAGARDLRH